jgi:hypothetical protein
MYPIFGALSGSFRHLLQKKTKQTFCLPVVSIIINNMPTPYSEKPTVCPNKYGDCSKILSMTSDSCQMA